MLASYSRSQAENKVSGWWILIIVSCLHTEKISFFFPLKKKKKDFFVFYLELCDHLSKKENSKFVVFILKTKNQGRDLSYNPTPTGPTYQCRPKEKRKLL